VLNTVAPALAIPKPALKIEPVVAKIAAPFLSSVSSI